MERKIGASGERRFRTDVLPYCSFPEPPTPGSGSVGGQLEWSLNLMIIIVIIMIAANIY